MVASKQSELLFIWLEPCRSDGSVPGVVSAGDYENRYLVLSRAPHVRIECSPNAVLTSGTSGALNDAGVEDVVAALLADEDLGGWDIPQFMNCIRRRERIVILDATRPCCCETVSRNIDFANNLSLHGGTAF